METKQQRRMEPIQQNHPVRGKQKQDYDWNIQKVEKNIQGNTENTVGIKGLRTDKPQTTNNKEIKEARKIKKEMRDKYHTACKSGSEGNKIGIKNNTWRARKNWET